MPSDFAAPLEIALRSASSYLEGLADAPVGATASLSELRAMRDRGEITPEEYERTRTHVIAKVKASFDRPKKNKNGPSGDSAVTEGKD